MNLSKDTKMFESSSTMDTSIITLIPCDYDSSEEDEKPVNISQDSINSSDILESSDDEIVITKITQFIKIEKNFDSIKEDKFKKNETNIV